MSTSVLTMGEQDRLDSGSSKLYLFTAALATPLTPLRTEISASTTYEIANIMIALNGFTVSQDTSKIPDWAGGFGAVVFGAASPDDSSLVTKAFTDGSDIRSILDPGDLFDLMICFGGDVPTNPAQVFHCRAGYHKLSSDSTEARRVETPVAILAADEAFAIPALS